jgi:hypothetical protein
MKLLILTKQEIKAFLWILGISLFGLISLFQANTLYLDDYLRARHDLGWNFNGRPLATLVTIILQLGRPFTDISPLPQIMAITVFSLGIIYLGRIFEIKNLLLLVLIGVITILNPYNLSMYSFIFDALPMTLGILLAIISLYCAIYTRENIKNNSKLIMGYFLSILFLITALCFYQTSLSFYFVGFIFYLISKLCKTKDYKQSIINFFTYTTILLSSMILYSPIKNIYELSEYTIKSGELPKLDNIIQPVLNNIIKSWDVSKYHFGNNAMLYLFLGLMIFVFLVICINILFINNGQQKSFNTFQNKIISIVLALFYYSIIIISFIFPSYILLNPPWHTRIFLGVTAIVCFSCFFLVKSLSNLKPNFLNYILVFYFSLITLLFTNLSLTYGNVIHQQDLYEERIGTLIINDIENLINEKSMPLNKPKVVFVNSEKVRDIRSNVLIKKSLDKYPILNSIAPPYFTPDNFGITKLETFGLEIESLPKEDFYRDNKDFYQPNNSPILKRQLYNIYLENDQVFVITFNE